MREPRFKRSEVINRIDMTAFASIMLIFLLIFMVPVVYFHDLSPRGGDLARVAHPVVMRGADREDAMIVALERDGRIYFGTEQVTPETLAPKIREAVKNGSERKVYFRADARAKWRALSDALDGVREAGIENVAFLVEQRRAKVKASLP